MNSKTKKEITEALKNKAVGFDTFETVEEFTESDGEIKLVKRKVTKKTVPPDVSAVKLLLDIEGESSPISSLSDEELENERAKLIKFLEGKLKNENRKMQN